MGRLAPRGVWSILDGGFVTTESFTTRRSGDIHITAERLALSGAAHDSA